MVNRIADLRCKDVINVCDGSRVGYVYDVEVDVYTGKIVALVVQGAPKCYGLLGNEPDIVILWHNVQKIGEDIIFIDQEIHLQEPEPKKRFFKK